MIRAGTGQEAAFIAHMTGGDINPPVCIVQQLGDRLTSGVLIEGFTGTNVFVHVWASALSKSFVKFVLGYIFNQLGCTRFTGIVPSTNLQAVNFNRKLGGEVEATLQGACEGGDLLLFVHRRENLEKWL